MKALVEEDVYFRQQVITLYKINAQCYGNVYENIVIYIISKFKEI